MIEVTSPPVNQDGKDRVGAQQTAAPASRIDGWAVALLLLGTLLTGLWVGGLAWLVISWFAWVIGRLMAVG
jgi:hypothetical protein